MLDYERPRHASAPWMLKWTVAILFAASALLCGAVLALSGARMLVDARTRPFANDRRSISQEGRQTLLCSLILLAPGIWYGRAALREIRSTRSHPADSPPLQENATVVRPERSR